MKQTEKWYVGYFFTINSIIGAGILAIPWAYCTAGWALGITCQIVILILSYSASYLMLSLWSRTHAIVDLIESGVSVSKVQFKDIFSADSSKNYIDSENEIDDIKPLIENRHFDLYEMIKLTISPFMSKFLVIAYIFAQTPALAGYFSVFAISLSSNVPILGFTCNLYDYDSFFNECRVLYWAYMTIFAAFLIFLAFFDITEQRWMQGTLTLFRFLVIAIFAVTTIYAIASDSELEDDGNNNANPEIFNGKHIGRIFFILCFASLYENIIPTTMSFVENKSTNLPKVLNFAILTFNGIYILVGVLLCFALEDPEEMATLNWRDYSAGSSQSSRSWWTYIIAYIVVLLPALDILSSFPIVCWNYSDNIMSIFHGHDSDRKNDKSIRFMFRLSMILSSFMIAFFFYELGLILEISGAFVLLLSGFFIPIGALAAQKIIKSKSEYDFKNNRLVALTTIVFSVVMFEGAFKNNRLVALTTIVFSVFMFVGCFIFLGFSES
ncbi:hypothetical protein SteCoe_11575 [Stentor coeruleus]|uniref:Amino acid transporter transmembrane domain-containing protein n=1 Tax=Stentor coeruleus TaxID=5963 RepID=A0A1R2CCU5_9CILI|nr:hypothetical protein SteCoe_11575 [Stentor coeruleus]